MCAFEYWIEPAEFDEKIIYANVKDNLANSFVILKGTVV